jgi:hypothetical protein
MVRDEGQLLANPVHGIDGGNECSGMDDRGSPVDLLKTGAELAVSRNEVAIRLLIPTDAT